MSYIIEGNDLIEMLNHEQNNQIEIFSDESSGKIKQSYHSKKANLSLQEEAVRDDLAILQGWYYTNEPFKFMFDEHVPVLEMHFNLSPSAIFYKNSFISSQIVPSMSGNMIYIQPGDSKSEIVFENKKDYHTFDVHFPLSILEHYEGEAAHLDHFLSQINRQNSVGISNNEIHITSKLFSTISDICHCGYTGITRKIYLESKVYELVAYCFDSIQHDHEITLSSYDKERIRLAAEIIKDNIDRPCTIIDLARKVGINQTKLKKGFKAIFDTTVFGYLQDIRMNKAKQYLLDTDLSIDEISLYSGYKNISNFSSAFKKNFGYAPSLLRKKEISVDKLEQL